MLKATADILEMIKFSHSVFALPFALLAAFLAARDTEAGRPEWGQIGLIVASMVAARSAAMAFNRLADVRFDAANPRTAGRHLPAGRLSVAAVAAFTVITGAAFLAVCVLFDVFYANPWPTYLGAPVLAFLLGYSYAKRFTALSHFWLGAALCLAPVAAFIALRGRPGDPGITAEALLLAGSVLLWTAGFDIIYACQDTDFDRRAGLRSVPAALGNAGALWLSRACHVGAVGCLAGVGVIAGLGPVFGAAVVLAAGLLVYEHSLVGDWRLSRPDLSRVDAAFFTVNGILSVAVAALAIADVLLIGR
jgi:4-hydroxybenzoate polyprenyltransferase